MTGETEYKAQLDKPEREDLEDVVEEMRERVESDIEYQLEQVYGLSSKEVDGLSLSSSQRETREELVEAIEREAVDGHSWDEAFDLYVKGVGYTLVNRLAAFRCMEVRDFIDREVTRFRDDGVTPAADPIIRDEFLDDQEGVFEAYRRECDELADEIEILFDRDDPYSIIEPQFDTFEDLCRMLDEIDDSIWKADDVLGWVYEYYNTPDLSEVREKARTSGLEAEDVPIANQFYTPHWVVRMLTDNSLGKLYLEDQGELLETIERQDEKFSVEERKNRAPTPEASPKIEDLCTYLVPTEEEGEPTDFDGPEDIRVMDPACGSGHFLLYAFDILERIWWNERPDLDRSEIPSKILENNLYGVDLDLRACQLAAFNLYLKARSRSEDEGADEFVMPQVGIVCADARIADVEDASEVFDEVASDQPEVRESLENILNVFENVHGLGSLLDVKGSLSAKFLKEQTTLTDMWNGDRSLSSFLDTLHNKIEERRDVGSFLAQDLKSFLRVLVVLSQDYDVALMNPPYGARNRMPDNVKSYVEEQYDYTPEFYINFFEVCDRLSKKEGRVGMLVPRSFMFKRSFQDFREDFIGEKGSFDFLAEYGLGVLDNATVYTAGTVVRTRKSEDNEGEFIRLHDADTYEKEDTYLTSLYGNSTSEVQRRYTRKSSDFEIIPGSPISYWVPTEIRKLYESDVVFDAENGNLERDSLGVVKQGLATGDDGRFTRYFWETEDDSWIPFSKGGEDSWILPRIIETVWWNENGKQIKRYYGSRPQNTQHYFNEALTYNVVKTKSGKRFGYLHSNSIFGHKGAAFIPNEHTWDVMAYSNSSLATYLMLCQTPERMWEISEVSKLPWDEELALKSTLDKKSKEVAGLLLSIRKTEFNSPHYTQPLLLELLNGGDEPPAFSNHSHRDLLNNLTLYEPNTIPKEATIEELGIEVEKFRTEINSKLEKKSNEIDEIVFDNFGINESQKETIYTEIALRMGEDPRKNSDYNPESITKPPEDLPELVKRLLLHFTLEIANEDSDGVVPLSTESDEEESDLLHRIEQKFEEVWGEYAEDRLAEADEILGDRKATDEPYPNIRYWLENKLFDFHVDEFERTPILWKLTTERLVSDPETEGFACIVDYHQLDSNIFDRITTRYLEPRKNALRNKRNAADQRRNDTSLPEQERSEADQEYQRCDDALRQINEFERVMQDLGRTQPRDWSEENQQKANDLAPKVREFRKRTEERLETLDKVREHADSDWMEDFFSPTFMERVNDNRDEWIDALKDLETACREYAKDETEPVEAHLYDLFVYYDDIVGSTHYGSNDITFMNYYFSKGEKFIDQYEGEKEESIHERNKHKYLVAQLAKETDRDVELAEEINEVCNDLASEIESEWKDRALEEITTAGYKPNKKHGVAINIQPLADKNIVPSVVEDRII